VDTRLIQALKLAPGIATDAVIDEALPHLIPAS
jgi:hypothetical protein